MATIAIWEITLDYRQPQAQQLAYIHNDHLGTPLLLTHQQGAVVWQKSALPFGQTANTLADSEQPLRFPGQYEDDETGLHYNYFRYYDSNTGRYITSDPIGLNGGINTYVYVINNPLRYTDPTGLVTLMIEGGADGIAGVGGRGSGGIYLTSGGDTGPVDAGVVTNGGGGAGFNPYVGYSATILTGGKENIDGLTVTTEGDIFGIGIESHINPTTGEWVGASMTFDLTHIPGVSVTINQ